MSESNTWPISGLPTGCRKCSICEGLDHHWDVFGDTDDDGEPVESCKHCDATRPLSEDHD